MTKSLVGYFIIGSIIATLLLGSLVDWKKPQASQNPHTLAGLLEANSQAHFSMKL